MPARGIRNNNPGNLKELPGDKTQWLGERATDDDPIFEEFETPEHGIRALAKVLRNYQRKHGLKTVRGVIGRWAPPSENETGAYARFVGRACAVHPDNSLDLEDDDVLRKLVKAIITFENGEQPYADAVINAGIRMA